jgi:hypothetical protein
VVLETTRVHPRTAQFGQDEVRRNLRRELSEIQPDAQTGVVLALAPTSPGQRTYNEIHAIVAPISMRAEIAGSAPGPGWRPNGPTWSLTTHDRVVQRQVG